MFDERFISKFIQKHMSIKKIKGAFLVDSRMVMIGMDNLVVSQKEESRLIDFSFTRKKSMKFSLKSDSSGFNYPGEESRTELFLNMQLGGESLSKKVRLTVAPPPLFDLHILIPQLLVYEEAYKYFSFDSSTTSLLDDNGRSIRCLWQLNNVVNTLDVFLDHEGYLESALLSQQYDWRKFHLLGNMFKDVWPNQNNPIEDKFQSNRVCLFVVQKLTTKGIETD